MMIHPLNQLSAQINQLHPRDLQQRIDITDCPSELIPVVHRLNEFIVQLEEAFDRERTTTANISHELRTPLAGLMATLEVAASRPRSTAEYQTTISQSTEILNQLQSLIERILLLSRLDAYKLVINPELIDLNKLLHEIASGYQVDSSIKWQLATGIMINTDKPSLTLIIRNLLANAITYSTAPDAIAIRTHLQSGEVTIELTNPSAVIAPSDLSQLKQRFFQSDANRIRNGQNGGLGLTFCDELANLIHGKLSLSQSHGIFRAVVAFHSHNS